MTFDLGPVQDYKNNQDLSFVAKATLNILTFKKHNFDEMKYYLIIGRLSVF